MQCPDNYYYQNPYNNSPKPLGVHFEHIILVLVNSNSFYLDIFLDYKTSFQNPINFLDKLFKI